MPRVLLRQIQMNSYEKGNPQIPEIKYNVHLEQKEGKVWQALVLISPTFVDPWSCESSSVLCPRSVRQEFLDHLRLLAISREVLHHSMPLTILHEVQDRCCAGSQAVKLSVIHVSGVIHDQPFSFRAGALCREVLLPRLRTCFPFFPSFLIFCGLYLHFISSVSSGLRKFIDYFIFPSFSLVFPQLCKFCISCSAFIAHLSSGKDAILVADLHFVLLCVWIQNGFLAAFILSKLQLWFLS